MSTPFATSQIIVKDNWISLLFKQGDTLNSWTKIGKKLTTDVFANPTREETFGLVNVEAIACGTPVVMFNTDGAPECIDETCGIVVEKNNVGQMLESIKAVCKKKIFSSDNCIKHAQNFNKDEIYEKYLEAYTELIKS